MAIDRKGGAAVAQILLGKGLRTAKSLGGCLKSRRLTLEPLEQRTLLAAGMIDLGPSDNIALDQPRVAIELLTPTGPDPDDWGSVGPSMFNTFLLDTGANGILAMATAVNDMSQAPYVYETQGTFLEVGVAGDHEMDISVPYRFDFAGTSGVRNTIDDARLMSDPNIDFSMFGPWGLVGMPAMVDRVTSIDMSVWSAGGSLEDLFMRVDFSDGVPADSGHRYSVPVDNRIQFDPVAQTTEGDPPVWGDVPFLTAIPTSNGLGLEGNFLFDTGAQMSVISEQMAFDLGLDANGNGSLDDEAIRFETVGGVGGTVTAPVLFIDEVRVPTEEGVDLVWTDLQWLALDIDLPGTEMTLDGVFGSDLLTSGWVEAFFNGGDDGYFQQVHFDFRSMDDNGTGAILFDVTPAVDQVIPPGPGVRVLETLGYTEVAEGGTEDFYRLVLTSQPASDVTIEFTSVDGQISVDSDAVPGTGSVTFTSENWDVPQVVRVLATNDDLAEGPHASQVTHTVVSTATGYDGLAVRAVEVDILDDDLSLLTVVESNDSTVVTEGGTNDSFTVQLGSAPSSTTYVLVEDTAFQTLVWREGSSPADLDGNLLTFDSSNWNTPQTVIVQAQDDEDPEGPHQTALTLSVVDGTTVRVIGQSALTVHIEDNDIGSVVLSETLDSTDVSEDGTTDTYSVALGKQPTQDVRIDLEDVAGQLTAVDSAHPENAFLIFTPDNWDTPQTVLVSAVDDTTAEGTHISQIAHRATSDDTGYDGLAIRDVRVRIEDNDGAGVVIDQTGGSTEVTEGGTADTYSIHLTSQPTANVQLNLVTGDQVDAVDNTNPANSFLLFTPDNWDTAQVVRVTAVDDHVVETAADVIVAHEALSTDSNYRGTHNLTVQVADNDTAGIIITESDETTTAIEGGAGDTYTVVLTSQPTHSVTVRLDVDAQVTADATQLVFTPDNWHTAQTVEVHAVDDSLVEGSHQGMIVHAVTSDDTNYHELVVAPVDVGITDNDTAGVVITESAETTTAVEGGNGDTYTVVLTSQPTHNVTVRLDVDSQVTADATQLVFTPENWHTAQTVEVHAVDDSLVEGSHQGMIVHAVTSDDTTYHELTVAPVDVGITDNDAHPLGQIDSTALTGLDPSAEPLWYSLETTRAGILTIEATPAEPGGDVTLTLHDSAGSEPALASSTFSNGKSRIDWNVQANETYRVKVTGSAANVDMQILNLVAHTGEQVTVLGTTAADSFSFAPTGSYMVTINGVDYHFDDSEVSGIVFTGVDGNDEAVINGSAGDDSGTLSPNSGEFSIAGATVTVDNVTSVIVYGGGGLDDVRLLDSPGDDTLIARGDEITFSGPGFQHETHGLTTNLVYAKRDSDDIDKAIFYDTEGRDKFKFDWPKPDQHFAKIYGSGYYNRAKYFEVVEVYFEGGGDIVKIFDSEGDDTFEVGADSSRLYGDGYDVTVHGYEQLTVCASQGNDSAHFVDSPSDDLVRARPHKAMMWYGASQSPVVTARRFDSYHFSAENGGYDQAKLHDTVFDDHLVAETDRATLYRNVDELDLLYQAVAFDWIKAYGTPDSDTAVNHNTRDVADAIDYELLYWGQWD